MIKKIPWATLPALFVFVGLGYSQTAQIEGTLVQANGTPEPNFEIVIENTETAEEYSTRTNQQGEFRFPSLPSGDYVLRSDIGQTDTIRLRAGGPGSDRIRLTSSSGGGRQPSVSTETESISMRSPAISEFFDAPVIRESTQAHWAGRDASFYGALNLSLRVEGVHPGTVADPFVGPRVSGLAQDSNNFEIEGVDNNDRSQPGPLLYIPDVGTRTFTVEQHGAATGGRFAPGGQFQVVTQSGGNEVHGSAYWFHQNRQLNARDSRLDRFNLDDNPRMDRNRFGGSVGFPLISNKLFGYANLEYIPYGFTRYGAATSTAPTAQGLGALASDSRIARSNLNLLRDNVRTVGAPVGTTRVNGADIPVAFVDTRNSGHINTWAGIGGLDFIATSRDRIAGRYVQNEVESSVSGFALDSFNTPSDTQKIMGTVSYTHTNGGSYVNDLRVGYNRLNSAVNTGDFQFNDGPFPNLPIQGADLALGPQFAFGASDFNVYQISDNANWVLGAHELSFGGDARKVISSQSGFPQFRGAYTYSSLERFLLDQTPDVSAQRAFGDPTLNANQWLLDFWVHDAWRFSPKLRLDLGLNYQWAEMPEFSRRQALNSSLDADGVANFDEPLNSNGGFGPQIGVAYAPGRKFVVRAGGGIQYDTLYLANRMSRTLGPQSELVRFSDPTSVTQGFLDRGGVIRPQDDRARLSTFFEDQRLPYTIHWNGGLQGSLWTNLTGSIRYVGNRGVRLSRFGNANPNGFVGSDRNLPVFFDEPTQGELDELDLTLDGIRNVTPSPQQAAGFTNPVIGLDNSGTSWYHSIVAEINQRMTRGVQMSARYTLADLQIDSYGSLADLGFERGDHFSAPYVPDHRLSLNGLLDIGALVPGTGIWGDIVANLSLSGTYTYMSNVFLPLTNGLDTSLTGLGGGGSVFTNPNGRGVTGTSASPVRNTAGQIVGYRADDPTARFVRGAPGAFTNNQASLDLNQTSNFDLAAAKKFDFREAAEIELRLEAYNVFNNSQLTGADIHGFRDGFAPGLALAQFIPGSTSFGNFRSVLPNQPRSLLLGLRVTF